MVCQLLTADFLKTLEINGKILFFKNLYFFIRNGKPKNTNSVVIHKHNSIS